MSRSDETYTQSQSLGRYLGGSRHRGHSPGDRGPLAQVRTAAGTRSPKRWPLHAPAQARWVKEQLDAGHSIETVCEALGRGQVVPAVGPAEQMPSPRSGSTTRRIRGAEITAARRVGLTVDEYQARVVQGLKFCTNCKTWHPLEDFGSDASRSDGRAAHCRISKRAGQRDRYIPRLRADGQRHAPARDGDVKQARRRLTHLIAIGRVPHPSKLACVKCGHTGTDRQHVYRHSQGFAPEHHETVEVMCCRCDPARKRGQSTT